MLRYAIYYEPNGYSRSGNVLGRQAAGAGFIEGVASSKPEEVWCFSHTREGSQDLARALASMGSARTRVSWLPHHQVGHLASVDLLYRPDPMLSLQAWRREAKGHQAAYSLCGVTHTTASHGVMEAF